MAFMSRFFRFPDFRRFSYDELLQMTDFFEETFDKMLKKFEFLGPRASLALLI